MPGTRLNILPQMKQIANIFNTVKTRIAAALMLAVAMTSCHGMIFRDEGDCDPYYKVRFVYDMNLKFADAFHVEVNDVTLYVIDNKTGKVVWQKRESGEVLNTQGYLMDVDVAPGNYTLIAWAGDGHRTSFSVSENDWRDNLQCKLNHKRLPDGSAHSYDHLDRLYYGKLDTAEFTDEQGVHVFTVPLVKDTNTIRVILQHLSGNHVDKDDFTFSITDDNAFLDWDNSLIDYEPVTYHAWHTDEAMAGIILPSGSTVSRAENTDNYQKCSAVVAEISVSRLMTHRNPVLRINRTTDNKTIVTIPIIDYCIMSKSYDNLSIPNQEYLDRQDTYPMTFFLDERDEWISSYICIGAWKIVLQNSEI